MPLDTRQEGGPRPAPAPAVRVLGSRARRAFAGGADRRLALLALVVAAALIAGLAWNLVSTQAQGRDYLDDAVQRRAGLTADVISSAFITSRTPRAARAEFGGRPRALRRAVRAASVAAEGQRVTVLDAGGRVLASAGVGRDPRPTARWEVQRALRGRPSLSDAFSDGRAGRLVELAVPYQSEFGRRVVLSATPVAVVQGFTQGLFATQSAFRGTEGYLIDGAGETLSSTRPLREGLPGSVWTVLSRSGIGRDNGRTFVSGTVASSRWRVVLSVSDDALYASVNGAPRSSAWLLFGSSSRRSARCWGSGSWPRAAAAGSRPRTAAPTPPPSSPTSACTIR